MDNREFVEKFDWFSQLQEKAQKLNLKLVVEVTDFTEPFQMELPNGSTYRTHDLNQVNTFLYAYRLGKGKKDERTGDHSDDRNATHQENNSTLH
jgi:hypothetical protein